MRLLIISCIAVVTVFSCAKKITPAATTEKKPSAETAVVTEVKTDIIPVESAMSIAGHATYDAKCGRCHNLKNPANYTGKQWAPIMDDMAFRARLDSTEKANVVAYVNFYSKP